MLEIKGMSTRLNTEEKVDLIKDHIKSVLPLWSDVDVDDICTAVLKSIKKDEDSLFNGISNRSEVEYKDYLVKTDLYKTCNVEVFMKII